MIEKRLDNIEVQGYEDDGEHKLFILLKEDDYLWLREQVEQVSELINIIKRKETYIQYLQRENDQHYREAMGELLKSWESVLEFTREHNESDYAYRTGLIEGLEFAIEELNNALEGEEWTKDKDC